MSDGDLLHSDHGYEPSLPHVDILTVGATSHGKSTLLAALLTGTSESAQADAHSPANGLGEPQVTIYATNHSYNPTDYLDATKLSAKVDRMATAAWHATGVILVVSAPELIEEAGIPYEPLTETRIHAFSIRKLGAPFLVALNQMDLLESTDIEWATATMQDLLKQCEFSMEEVTIVPVSAYKAAACGCARRTCQWCGGIKRILDWINQVAPLDRGSYLALPEAGDSKLEGGIKVAASIK